MAPKSINITTSTEVALPRCPDCNSLKLTFDATRGEVSCGSCGLVVEDSYIDQTAEWRAYSKEQHVKRARTGTPKNLLTYDHYGTLIDYSNKDIFGNSIDPYPLNSPVNNDIPHKTNFNVAISVISLIVVTLCTLSLYRKKRIK